MKVLIPFIRKPPKDNVFVDLAEQLKSAEHKPLFIPLKTEYYNAFAQGVKDTEYRLYGPRWNERTCFIGRKVVISKGYGKANRLTGRIIGFRVKLVGSADWIACYGKPDRAACITILLDK